MGYDDKHRTFLQMIMQEGIISDSEIQLAALKIFNYNNSASPNIRIINSKLEPLHMTITSSRRELTGEVFWGLSTAVLDNSTRFQTIFSQAQLELMRRIFSDIIASAEGNISSTACLNLCDELQNSLSKQDADLFLTNAVRSKWLDEKDGQYYMGVRSILELMPYFRATYGDGFKVCPSCKQTLFHGQQCHNCEVVAHLYCLAVHAKIVGTLRCLNCHALLPTENLPDVHVDVESAEVSDVVLEDSPPSQKRSRKN